MVSRHDKSVLVFSNHVSLEHFQKRGSCAFYNCNACKQQGTDMKREDRVLWRERERRLLGKNGIKAWNDGAKDLR